MKKQSGTFKSGALPRFFRGTCITGLLTALVLLLSIQSSFAGSATWLATPATGDWHTAANWTAGGPPNGSADTATFAVSNTTGVSLSATAEVNSTVFNSGASPFTITASPTTALVISGAGITNNSGIAQNFVTAVDGAGQIGQINFTNSATAGSQTIFTNAGSTIGNYQAGGSVVFFDNSSAGDAILTNLGGVTGSARGGVTEFYSNSTAGNAQVTLNGGVASASQGAFVFFHDSATAGNGTFLVQGGAPGASFAWVYFDGNSNAGNGTFVTDGGLVYIGGAANAANGNFTNGGGGQGGSTSIDGTATGGNATFTSNGAPVAGAIPGVIGVSNTSTAGNATFTINGGAVSGAAGGSLVFTDYMGLVGAPTAANATITVNGGEVSGAAAGLLQFANSSTAENATLVGNGGAGGGDGGKIQFTVDSTGGAALVTVSGNGNLDISGHNPPGVTIGSIEGSGVVFLGANSLTIGSNNLSTTFSGTIQDGGLNGGTGGSLTKTGKGKLTLSTASTYTGGTTVSKGTLLVTNKTGSATGRGTVLVNAGTLGGTGKISGAVTVASGATSAVLAPGSSSKPGKLTMLSTLVFNSHATYRVDLNNQTAKADSIVAKGVTINSGAVFSIFDPGSGTLTTGTVFTMISNTAATPIAGTFSNVPDGSTISVGSDTFQVSYEGGDGNDLTITVL